MVVRKETALLADTRRAVYWARGFPALIQRDNRLSKCADDAASDDQLVAGLDPQRGYGTYLRRVSYAFRR
jgi:hypothetical protein